jgi:raffinose/stachyose/melibiose transport system substrate-binding protein
MIRTFIKSKLLTRVTPLLALWLVFLPVQAQEDPITLTFSNFWTDLESGSGLLVQQRLAAYKEAYPNVTTELQTQAHDEYITKFRVLASADDLPDVFIMNADQTTPLSNGGQLLNITEDLNADPAWRDLQNPGGMVEWTRDGNIYGMPSQMIITHVIYWNKAMFAEVGLDTFPDTWEGLKEAIVKLKEARHTPIALGSKAGWPLFDCLFGTLAFRSIGLDWYNQLLAHEVKFTDPEFVRALTTFKELVDIGAFNADATSLDNAQARALYYNQDAAMFIEGNWAISEGLAVDAPEDVQAATGIALWPAIPEGKGAANEVTWAAGWGWGLNSKLEGAKRDAAIALVKALSDEDYGRARVEMGQSAAQTVAEFDASKLPPLLVELNTMSQNWKAVPILTLGFPTSVTDVLSTGLQEIMTGQATPEDVAADVQTEYEDYAE